MQRRNKNDGPAPLPILRLLAALEHAGCAPRRAGSRWVSHCPAHDDQAPSVSITEGDDHRVLVHCFAGCELERILQALDFGISELFASSRHTARAGMGAPCGAQKSTPCHKQRPPKQQVHALWARCRPLDQDRETSAWASTRGLDPFTIADRDLCRALPADATVPGWAHLGGAPWPEGGYRLVLPLYDPSGRIASLHARNVRPDAVPKGALPASYAASGLIMAEGGAAQMLAGGVWQPHDVWIAEGVPDFLTLASDFNDADDESVVLGVVSGSWSKEIADRIPEECRVVVATHDDSAGERYASTIATTLTPRQQLFRWSALANEA